MKNEIQLTWAEINLNNLSYNIKGVKKIINKSTKIMAVIKADGYGHGAVQIGQTLLDNGIDYFAASNLREALHLRSMFHILNY